MMKHYINLERPHLMNPSMNVILKADFKGVFDESVFRKAVTELANAYAILRATVQIDEKGRAYFLSADANEIPVKILVGGTSFEQLVLSENQKMFDLEKESMLRIFVMPLPAAFSVVFISHHLLGDGKSSIMLMESLCRAYMGMKLDYVGIQLIKDSDNFPKDSEPSELSKLHFGKLNKAWRKDARIFSFGDYKKMFTAYHKERETGIYLMSFNAVETRKAFHHCKNLDITLDSGVVAAFMYAQKEIDERHREHLDKIGIEVDIRKELNFDASKLIGNYASAFSIEYGKTGKDNFEKVAVKVHKQLKKKMKSPKEKWLCLHAVDWVDGSLMDAGYFSQYGDFENKTAQKCAKMMGYEGAPMELGVTNLGKLLMFIPPELILESVVFVPPAAPGNDITIGVVTYQGIMRLAVMYQASFVRRDTVKEIVWRAKELLIKE